MPPRASLNEKQVTVRRFMDMISAAGVSLHHQGGNRYIKWNVLPEHLWDRGVYLRLPREIIFDSPTQTVEERIHLDLKSPWTEENAEIMRKALDEGEVQILPRPADRSVVFEAFDQNGNVTEVGKFGKRKRDFRRQDDFYSDIESSRGETGEESDSELEDDAEDSSRGENTQRARLKEVFKLLKQIYRNAHLDAGGQVVNWKELPLILARKKLYMAGIPVECVPNVVDDQIDSSSLPSNWSDKQCTLFITAARSGAIKVLRRNSNGPVLFQWTAPDGTIVNSTLQFSPAWIQKHMRASVVNNDGIFRQRRVPTESERTSRIPPGAVVTASGRGWVVVEESTDDEEEAEAISDPKDQRKQLRVQVSSEVLKTIADADIRGDGSEVTWNTLPAALASSNKYVVGIPSGGLPKVKDDKVIFQASHPSLWSGEVILQMKEILSQGGLKILPRPPGRIVLFEVAEGKNGSYDSTLGYSHDWLITNIPDPLFDQMKPDASARLKQKNERGNQSLPERKSPKPKPIGKSQPSGKVVAKDAFSTDKRSVGARTRKAEEKAKAKGDSDRARAKAEAIARERFGLGENSGVMSNPSFRPSLSFQSTTQSRSSTPHSNPSAISSGGTESLVQSNQLPNNVAKPAMHPRHAFKGKQKTGASNGNGSHPSVDVSRHSRGWSFSSAPLTAHADSQSSIWSPATGVSELAIKSPDPSQIHFRSWPPAGYPKVLENNQLESVSDALARFFERHALINKATPLPWLVLPQLLADRRQYLRGVPFNCIPLVKEDQVDGGSAVKHWNADMAGAMNWVLANNVLSIHNRESGRRVLFEVIGSDGTFYDSTLGYSDRWLDTFLPDTTEHSTSNHANISAPLTPVISLKRTWTDSTGVLSPKSPNGMDVDREIKRRRIDEDDFVLTGSPVSTKSSTARLGGFKITFSKSHESSPESDSAEEAADPRDLDLDRLIPSHLPRPLQGGRVFLKLDTVKGFGKRDEDIDDLNEIPGLDAKFIEEIWEWIPPEDHPKTNTSTVWNPTQARWRVVTSSYSMEHSGVTNGKESHKASPDVVQGNILGRGDCEYNDARGQWEMVFKQRSNADNLWIVRWAEDFGKWEWVLSEQK